MIAVHRAEPAGGSGRLRRTLRRRETGGGHGGYLSGSGSASPALASDTRTASRSALKIMGTLGLCPLALRCAALLESVRA